MEMKQQNLEMDGLLRDNETNADFEEGTGLAANRETGVLGRFDGRSGCFHIALIILYTGVFWVLSSTRATHDSSTMASRLVHCRLHPDSRHPIHRFHVNNHKSPSSGGCPICQEEFQSRTRHR